MCLLYNYLIVFVLQPAVLAKHILSEVPRQVCDYYSIYGIQPGAGVSR